MQYLPACCCLMHQRQHVPRPEKRPCKSWFRVAICDARRQPCTCELNYGGWGTIGAWPKRHRHLMSKSKSQSREPQSHRSQARSTEPPVHARGSIAASDLRSLAHSLPQTHRSRFLTLTLHFLAAWTLSTLSPSSFEPLNTFDRTD